MPRGEIIPIPQIAGCTSVTNVAPRESGRQHAHAEPVSHRGQTQTALLDWLHAVDPTTLELTVPDLVREPTIY